MEKGTWLDSRYLGGTKTGYDVGGKRPSVVMLGFLSGTITGNISEGKMSWDELRWEVRAAAVHLGISVTWMVAEVVGVKEGTRAHEERAADGA